MFSLVDLPEHPSTLPPLWGPCCQEYYTVTVFGTAKSCNPQGSQRLIIDTFVCPRSSMQPS
jgi:hypothetical protein